MPFPIDETHRQDKEDYESVYAVFIAEEKKAWERFRRGLYPWQEYKELSKSVKHVIRNAHRVGYCCGGAIPTEYAYLNQREKDRRWQELKDAMPELRRLAGLDNNA